MFKKLIIAPCIVFFCFSTLKAEVTLCFKKNHQDIATIENIKLEGGECNSKNTVNDMKKIGWIITDIKITPTTLGTDFIY